jgi:tetratricopeptide (TPR) repeat protein
MLLWEQKRYASAEEYYQRALALRRQKLGLYHPGILQILHDLANIAAEQDKNEETEQYFHEIFAIAPHAGGTESYEYAILLKAYVDFLQGCGRLDEARQYQNEFNKLCKRLAMKGPLYSLNLPQGNDEGGPDSSSAIFWSF